MVPQLLSLALLVGQPTDQTVFINQELARRWDAEKLTPAARTSDLEFLRRASLDLIGRIPTVVEQQAYQRDAEKERPRLLVDRLLAHDDYARHWANVWTHWLLGPSTDEKARPAFHGWLQQHFAKNGSHKELAEDLLTVKGSAHDNPAVHFYIAHRGQPIPEKNWGSAGQYDMMPLTSQVFRVLHGRRLQCIQCHDHAFDSDVHQQQFFQMNIFFRQVRFTKDAISDDPKLNENGMLPFERRNGPILFDKPRFGGETWTVKSTQTRREFFAERFVKHPQFARAYVNFIWAELMGHGLTKTDFDDMDGDNPVIHKALLDRLGADFVRSGHVPKSLLRWICNSDAYALKSVANKTNIGTDKAVYFSRAQVRPLSRRVLVESLAVALTTTDYVQRREKLREELLREITPAASPEMTHCDILPLNVEELSIRQVLWLSNSSALHRELVDPKGTVAKAIKNAKGASAKTFPAIASELFSIALCRTPTPAEMQRLQNPKNIRNVAEAEFWRTYCEDIFWALVNTNEFGSNH